MDPAVSQAAVAIEHDMNPNVLRRWVIEHERLGLHELDGPEAGGRTAVARAPATWLPFVPVQAARSRLPVAAPSKLAGPHPSESCTTIQVDLAAAGLSITMRWPVTEHQALAQWTRQLLA